jgi:hypothetical protein
MKKFFLLCCTSLIAFNIFAESVYTYDLAKDTIIGFVSLSLTATSVFINRSTRMASENIFSNGNLQEGSVNAFDRSLMFEYNKPIDTFSDITLYGLFALPLVSMAGNLKDGNVWMTYGIMYTESLLLVFGTCEFFKNTILRYRPYNYFGDIPAGKGSDYFKSFPSRHTAFAFMSAGFAASTFLAEYPDSPWKIPLAAAAYTLASGVGAGRIFSGSHFISDVLAGAVIGSLYGHLIPRLHLEKKRDNISLTPLPNGFVVSCKL